MIFEGTSLSCWWQGNVYKETAKPTRKCSLLWYSGLFHNWKQKKQAWGQRLQYASTIIPGNCQSFVMYHLDPIQKVNQPMITKYQRVRSVLINLRLSKACLQHFLLHFPHSGLAWASTCPSGIRILWLLQPFKATHTDFL